MITVRYYGKSYNADKATRTMDTIVFYDNDNMEVNRLENIKNEDWLHVRLEGEWTDPNDIPTELERVRADLDFVTMENEYLNEVNEQQQADIDYCLMLLEE